jgi:Secretion system C-terminal sorting domain
MMKKKLLLSTAMLLIASCMFAQRTATLFQKTYKITSADTTASLAFESVTRTTDGGYAFLGNYETRRNGGDMCVIRTDSLGAILWSVNINSDTTEAPEGIRQTPDGGFVVSGWNVLPNGFGEMLLAKIDASGVVKWSTQFGGPDIDEARDVAVLNSGDIFVVGSSFEGANNRGYCILTKKDGVPENGKIVQFGNAPAPFYSVDKTTDGGAIGASMIGNFFQVTGLDPGIVKFNALGNVEWGKRYATAGSQLYPIVRQTRDAGYILVGQQGVTQPNGQVVVSSFAIKTNTVGDTLWCRAFRHETDKFHRAYAVADVGDGYIVSGVMKPGYLDSIPTKTAQGRDTIITLEHEAAYAMKIDQAGVFKWAKYYGDSTRICRGLTSVEAADGGITLAGESFGFGNANRYGVGYVIHTDKEGNLGTGTSCKVKNFNFTVSTFRVKDSTNVVSAEGGDELASNLRREAITTVRTDICTGTGLNTDVPDFRLPDNAVKIYPNPVRTQLFIEIEANTEGGNLLSNIQIFDATGRLIQAQKTNNDLLNIDVSAFASGIYVVKVERGGKYLTKKFIVE